MAWTLHHLKRYLGPGSNPAAFQTRIPSSPATYLSKHSLSRLIIIPISRTAQTRPTMTMQVAFREPKSLQWGGGGVVRTIPHKYSQVIISQQLLTTFKAQTATDHSTTFYHTPHHTILISDSNCQWNTYERNLARSRQTINTLKHKKLQNYMQTGSVLCCWATLFIRAWNIASPDYSKVSRPMLACTVGLLLA